MFAHRGVVSSRMLFVQASMSSLHPGRPRNSRPIVMMVDTGARFSVVADDVLAALGIAPSGFTDVRTSLHHVVQRPAYQIALSLEFVDDFGQQHVARVPLNAIGRPPLTANLPGHMGLPHEGLLGMDFLSHFQLIFNGPARTFELTCDDLPSLPSPPTRAP